MGGADLDCSQWALTRVDDPKELVAEVCTVCLVLAFVRLPTLLRWSLFSHAVTIGSQVRTSSLAPVLRTRSWSLVVSLLWLPEQCGVGYFLLLPEQCGVGYFLLPE